MKTALVKQRDERTKGGQGGKALAHDIFQLAESVIVGYVGVETVSWVCILGAAPFAALGFINYHGMTAEQFVIAWLRSEVIEPKHLTAEKVNNIYYEATKDLIAAYEKEGYTDKSV